MGQLCLGCLLAPDLPDEADRQPPVAGPLDVAMIAGVTDNRRFAHYEVALRVDGTLAELGRGGMGVTYQATDTTLRCAVALKVVKPDLVQNAQVRGRFLREAQVAAKLRHPHVASVFFFGERAEDGQLFYAMELVEGETLHTRVRRCGGLPVETVLQIGVQVTAALAAAEEQGLTHRDLKPANLMLVRGETINVKVIDFGLAKSVAETPAEALALTRAQDFIGTPAFASPEHFNVWQEVDARSDFYALGATLWYALTGKAPFAGRSLDEIHDRQVHHPLPLDELQAARVPAPVVELLRALLSPDPTGRPQTAGELAAALARCRQPVAGPAPKTRGRAAALAVAVAVGLLALCAARWMAYRRSHLPPDAPPATVPAREKSVAVLPFDNLSEDKGNAFFADGVQDEILTDLAKSADLKVISRTSVLGYRDPAKRPSAREIGHALGVAYLLEGSVQRDGNRVRLSAQLIDTASDRHVWAETFDRELSDVFSIQSEVANTIVGKLQARLSGAEKAAIDEPPTHDFAAYELFLHAKEIMYSFDPNTSKWDPLYESERLLDEATARDPAFYEAWVLLANVHSNLLLFSADPTPTARTALAEKTLATLRRLRPDDGITHLAYASYFYSTHDPEHGRPELALARQRLPNNWKVLFVSGTTGVIDGRWADAIAAMEKARTLNPRHVGTLDMLTIYYAAIRRYDEAERVAQEAIAAGISPDYFAIRHAKLVLDATGDLSEYRAVFKRLDGQGVPSERNFILRWDCAVRARDFDEAARLVAADPRQEFSAQTSTIIPRAYLTGEIAYARGDLAAARKDLGTARAVCEDAVRRRPTEAIVWMLLAEVDGHLGRKEDAVREGERSVALMPISHDASQGPKVATSLASVYGLVGEKDRAITALQALENVPNAYDYGYLKTHPDWDIYRGDARFEALLQAIRRPVDLSKFNPANFPPPTVTNNP